MWYIVVLQPSKCRDIHFQPQIWSIWRLFPIHLESLLYKLKKLRNSELGGARFLKVTTTTSVVGEPKKKFKGQKKFKKQEDENWIFVFNWIRVLWLNYGGGGQNTRYALLMFFWKCWNLRTFWEDQMDPKSAVGGPNQFQGLGGGGSAPLSISSFF